MCLDRLRSLALVAALATVTACAPNTAREGCAKVYGSPAQKDANGIELERLVFSGPVKRFKRDVGYDPDSTIAGRLGIWFNAWGGIALDGSYFRANGSGFNNDIVSATPLLLLRAQFFKSDGVPDGHFQPYFGIGPGVFFTDQEVDLRPDISSKSDITHISVGVDLRAGMRWQLSRNLGIFGEYRLTRYKPGRNNNDNAAFSSEEHVNSTLTTNHFIGGLSFVF